MTEITLQGGFTGRGETTPWGAVVCLSLLTFLLVGLEFLPTSLLTPIARDLSITEGQTGLAIAVSGFFAIITSLFGNVVFAGLDRRTVSSSIRWCWRSSPPRRSGVSSVVSSAGEVPFLSRSPSVLRHSTPIPVAWNNWMTRIIPDDLEAGGGLQVALIQSAIAGGAFAGGVLFDTVGWWSAFLLAAILLAGSAVLAATAHPGTQPRPQR